MLPVILYSSVTFLDRFAPTNASFLRRRFQDVTTSRLPKNAESRVEGFHAIEQYLSPNNLFTGAGFSVTRLNSSGQLELGGIVIGDSLWTLVFFKLGYFGVMFFLLLFVLLLLYSLRILGSSKYENQPRFLKLMSMASVWIIVRSTASSELLWYPVIYGLVFATLNIAYSFPSISYSSFSSDSIDSKDKL